MVAYHSQLTNSLDQAAKFKGFNGVEFTAVDDDEDESSNVYNVLLDECSVSEKAFFGCI